MSSLQQTTLDATNAQTRDGAATVQPKAAAKSKVKAKCKELSAQNGALTKEIEALTTSR